MRLTTEQFIEKAKKVHGDKYDYSKVEYIKTDKNVCIICPEHGEFWQTPNNHLSGRGCPKCKAVKIGDLKRNSIEKFIEICRRKHGDKYDYSKVSFKRTDDKVCIICPVHGEFWQMVNSHMKGCGCQKCYGNKKSDNESFIIKSKSIHGDKYDYSKVEYINNRTNVCIICPEHGEFWQTPKNHLKGQGCNKCAIQFRANECALTTEEFVKRAKEVHGDKYDYTKVAYKRWTEKVIITCPIHGDFKQTPGDHLSGCGCPICGQVSSKAECEIIDYIKHNHKIECEKRKRDIIKPYELDIYIPSQRIAIEFNGLIWHSEKFNKDNNKHLYKTRKCNEKGIELLHIFEDEWNEKQDIVKSIIDKKLGKYKISINSKNCIVNSLNKKDVKQFFNNNHIDGFYSSKYNFGLYHNQEIVSAITLIKIKPTKFLIKRFCNKKGYNVINSLKTILEHISKIYYVENFTFRHDIRLGNDKDFKDCGFKSIKLEKPDYMYVKNGIRLKRYSFKKNKFENKENTVRELMNKESFYRIYDCGKEVLVANSSIFMDM